ncbi:aminotransferase class V-fold PLP-dependent enzyme [Aquamicrobium sp. LC103]|uniref:pyridoxal-phosphate-dependent aminotransferase family protein n=1 Tax=Aquamicrobium sp. LC103 TaxID=1120658 RepID=UPI00063E8898|nr:aminotransferase class V-fold PLP-dependent enzyme [Aquamicrobium sp. LC103]TKT74663.1 alanine--glyoxylate aminotransferase family protein [Aquamicrobium sp. LC103]
MTDPKRPDLLDLPAYPPPGYAILADRIAALLRTRNPVLLVQGEAIVALEAVATSLGNPEIRALNVVTSPYGRLFGDWLRRAGAETVDLVAEPGQPVTVEAFTEALENRPRTNLVALVHAESATGILNPLPEIVRLANSRGALIVLDAVASVGGHDLDVDDLGIDVAVIGPQKALGGSSGLSAVAVSARALEIVDRLDAPTSSVLSLADLKRNWLDTGRGVPPGMPSALEFYAMEAALDRIEAEGLEAAIARHALTGAATRAGLRALGLRLWAPGGAASNLVTTALLPEGCDAEEMLRDPAVVAANIDGGVGANSENLVRLNHTGSRARREIVLENVLALGDALQRRGRPVDLDAAERAISECYTGAAGDDSRS